MRTPFGDVPPGGARLTLPRGIRNGAAVYGSLLAAAVISAMSEAGADARTMTGSVVASMLIFWLAHAGSEVVGENIAAGPSFHPASYL